MHLIEIALTSQTRLAKYLLLNVSFFLMSKLSNASLCLEWEVMKHMVTMRKEINHLISVSTLKTQNSQRLMLRFGKPKINQNFIKVSI